MPIDTVEKCEGIQRLIEIASAEEGTRLGGAGLGWAVVWCGGLWCGGVGY